MRIAYCKESGPTARTLRDTYPFIELVKNSIEPVDINWGRAYANSVLNPDTSNASNKRRMRELFESHGVPMPKLYTLREAGLILPDDGQDVLLLGRPDRHTRKQSTWKIRHKGDLLGAARGNSMKRPATHFMEFITKERAPREYRAHIFMGKSIRISEKTLDSTRDCGYITTLPRHNISHVREAAKLAMKAVDLHFGAVDILASDSECFVLEVNSAPGLGGTMPDVYINAFRRWKEGGF